MKQFVAILLLFLTCSLWAANWYVDPTATGAGDGSSWSNAWTTLTQDEINATPGDTIYFSGGPTGSSQTYQLPLIYTTRWHTYKVGQDSAHNGMVIFDGQGTVPYLICGQCDYAVMSGDNSSGDGQCHMTVQNYGTPFYGDGSTGVTLDHLVVNGILRFISATNTIITYCQLTSPDNADGLIQWGSQGSPAGFPYTNASINHCTIIGARQNDSTGFGTDLIQGSQCNDSSIHDNLFDHYYVSDFTEGQHQDDMQFNSVISDLQIYNNVIKNGANTGVFFDSIPNSPQYTANVFIYNNLFIVDAPSNYNNGYTKALELTVQGGANDTWFMTNWVIANNTFVDWHWYGFSWDAYGVQTNCLIANNLFYDCGSQTSAPGGAHCAVEILAEFSGNMPIYGFPWTKAGLLSIYNYLEQGVNSGVYGSTCYDPDQDIPSTGTPPVKFVSYAMYSTNNDLHIAAGDTAVTGQGTNLTSAYPFLAVDRDGSPRPATGNWTVGAYQYVSPIPTHVPWHN